MCPFSLRYDAGTQKRLIQVPDYFQGESKTILEQLEDIGMEQISEILASKDLTSFCKWMVSKIDHVAEFSALKVGGSMMVAGELLSNDDAPEIGLNEGCATAIRCLAHAYKTTRILPTWLKTKELNDMKADCITKADMKRIMREMQANWTPKVDQVWSIRRTRGDGADRWGEAVEVGFRPTRTILGIEEVLCEGGCRLLRAIEYARNPLIGYPKGEFTPPAQPKRLTNVTLLHVDGGRIIRTTGVSFVPSLAPALPPLLLNGTNSQNALYPYRPAWVVPFSD